MKKLTFLATLLMIAALVLSACAPGNNNDDATPGVLETPADVGMPTTDTGAPVATEAATMASEATATLAAATPTAASGVVATEAATQAAAKPGAPVAGDDDCNPNTVQGLLDMDVVDAQGTQIGDVNSLIILRDKTALGAPAAPADAAASTPAASTPAASTPAASTPAADAATTPAGAGNFMAGAAPQVAYVIIDLENEDSDAVVPLSALDMTVRDRDVQTDTNTATTPAATAAVTTPAAGATDGVGDVANEFDKCFVTLKNVQAGSVSELPMFDREADFTADNWDKDYRAYWTGQGLQIPATGASSLGAPAVVDDEFNNINALNPNGDDLGEVEDFIFNPQTGEVSYAILAAGGFLGLGETKLPVPIARVQWLDDDPGDKDDAGYVVINIKDEKTWKNAPTLDDRIDMMTKGWDEKIQAYWNSITD